MKMTLGTLLEEGKEKLEKAAKRRAEYFDSPLCSGFD